MEVTDDTTSMGSNQRGWHCEFCRSEFPSRRKRLHHLRLAHGSESSNRRIIVCDACRIGFLNKQVFLNHMRLRHGIRIHSASERAMSNGMKKTSLTKKSSLPCGSLLQISNKGKAVQTTNATPDSTPSNNVGNTAMGKGVKKATLSFPPSKKIRNLLGMDRELWAHTRRSKLERRRWLSRTSGSPRTSSALSYPVCPAPRGTPTEIGDALERTILLLAAKFDRNCCRNRNERNGIVVESPVSAMQFTYRYTVPLPCFAIDFYALAAHGLRNHRIRIVKGQGNSADATRRKSFKRQPDYTMVFETGADFCDFLQIGRP